MLRKGAKRLGILFLVFVVTGFVLFGISQLKESTDNSKFNSLLSRAGFEGDCGVVEPTPTPQPSPSPSPAPTAAPSPAPSPLMCGTQTYDPGTQGCCHGRVYNTSTQQCCNGRTIVDKEDSDGNLIECGSYGCFSNTCPGGDLCCMTEDGGSSCSPPPCPMRCGGTVCSNSDSRCCYNDGDEIYECSTSSSCDLSCRNNELSCFGGSIPPQVCCHDGAGGEYCENRTDCDSQCLETSDCPNEFEVCCVLETSGGAIVENCVPAWRCIVDDAN